MKIVGVGCGPGLLTEEAIESIRNARRILGSGRAIELVKDCIPETCLVEQITDFRRPIGGDETTVVLSTGDPMLGGLGYLDGEVVPGISSLQLAAARLHIPLSKVCVVTAHGRDHSGAAEETVSEVRRGKIVFLLADPSFDPKDLFFLLRDCGPVRIALCSDLGYPQERIVTGTPDTPPGPVRGLFSLFIGNFPVPLQCNPSSE
ncbi:MAG: cobalt-precorrin-7 (C(5))-methyltransferase [Methanoregulaceae archaeon]|nr:cobalt-precorrin-7 (C(5))-methyltransferase [Methanoregulaceae archaeon]